MLNIPCAKWLIYKMFLQCNGWKPRFIDTKMILQKWECTRWDGWSNNLRYQKPQNPRCLFFWSFVESYIAILSRATLTTNSNSNKVQSGLGIALNWLSALILNFLLYNWIIVSNVLLKHEPFHTSLHGVFFEPNQNQTLRTLKTWQPLMQASQISKHYDYQ